MVALIEGEDNVWSEVKCWGVVEGIVALWVRGCGLGCGRGSGDGRGVDLRSGPGTWCIGVTASQFEHSRLKIIFLLLRYRPIIGDEIACWSFPCKREESSNSDYPRPRLTLSASEPDFRAMFKLPRTNAIVSLNLAVHLLERSHVSSSTCQLTFKSPSELSNGENPYYIGKSHLLAHLSPQWFECMTTPGSLYSASYVKNAVRALCVQR